MPPNKRCGLKPIRLLPGNLLFVQNEKNKAKQIKNYIENKIISHIINYELREKDIIQKTNYRKEIHL